MFCDIKKYPFITFFLKVCLNLLFVRKSHWSAHSNWYRFYVNHVFKQLFTIKLIAVQQFILKLNLKELLELLRNGSKQVILLLKLELKLTYCLNEKNIIFRSVRVFSLDIWLDMAFMPKNQLNLHSTWIFKLNEIQFFHLYPKLF